jgi:hypothetical protein
MADYSAKRADVLGRIAQLEQDQKTFTDAGKLARVKVKIQNAKDSLARIEAKQAGGNGSPPKATKRAKRARR